MVHGGGYPSVSCDCGSARRCRYMLGVRRGTDKAVSAGTVSLRSETTVEAKERGYV